MDGHVETSKEGGNLNWGIRGKKLKGKGKNDAQMGHLKRKEILGPYMDPLVYEKAQEYNNPANSLDLVNIEVQAFTKADNLDKISHWRKLAAGEGSLQISAAQGVAVGAKDMEGAIVAGETELNQVENQGEEGNLITVEATPLDIQFPDEHNPQSNTPVWIQQHIIKLGKEFGVDFKGSEEKVLELFLKIDGNKLETNPIRRFKKSEKKRIE